MLQLLKNTSISTFTTSIVAGIITLITPALVIIEVAQSQHYSQESIVNWLFGFLFFAGCIGLFLAWKTKQPINAATCIPAIVFLGFSLQNFSIETAAFGYACSGIILAFIGVLKLYDKIMRLIKVEIVFAMFAGTMIQYAVNIVSLTSGLLIYGSVAIIAFLLAMRYSKLIPPVLVAMVVVTIMLGFEGAIPYNQFLQSSWIYPEPFLWSPSWSAFLSLSLPLVLIVLSAELTIGISILRSEQYHPPVNEMTLLTGIGTIIGSFFGNPSVSTSGVPIGILSAPSTGPKHARYISAIWASLFTILFGVFAHFILLFFSIYPQEILRLFVGLTLIPILIKALTQSFGSGLYKYGAFTAFIISMSSISILKIGAPFWAIIIGLFVSLLVDKNNF